ncbi:MAG: hypothetical protein ACM3YO_03325 [Bacteroidota bacterium]
MGIFSIFGSILDKFKPGKKAKRRKASKSGPLKGGKNEGKGGFKRAGAGKPTVKAPPKPAAKTTSLKNLGPQASTAKYAEVEAKLNDALKELNATKTRQALNELTKTGTAIEGNARDKEESIENGVQQLERILEQKDYSITSRLASTLINDANILTDPALELAREQGDLVKKIEKALSNKDRRTSKQDVGDLVQLTANLDELIKGKVDAINALSNKLQKALAEKDYHTVAGSSERIAKDTAILSVVYSGKQIELTQETGVSVLASGGDRLANLKKKASELKKAIMERNFLGAMELARNISQSAALVAHPSLSKATGLLEQGDHLRKALKDRNKDACLMLASGVNKASGGFKGQSLDRSKQINDQWEKLQQASREKDYSVLLNTATSIWRETAILSDMVFFRATSLAQQIGRIEAAVKADDFNRALLSIEKIIL